MNNADLQTPPEERTPDSDMECAFQATDRRSYEDYIRTVIAACTANPSWRYGQAYFNTLCDVAPELAEEIRGRDLDPFHRDEVLPSFLVWLQLVWPHPIPTSPTDQENGA